MIEIKLKSKVKLSANAHVTYINRKKDVKRN